MNWKAKLPRLIPDQGTVHFVFAIKTSSGFRTEHSGTGNAEEVLKIYQEMMKLGPPTAHALERTDDIGESQ